MMDLAARWVDELPHRWAAAGLDAPRRLLDAAMDTARNLGPESGRTLIHTDLHFRNVLAAGPDAAAGRGRWLARPEADGRRPGVRRAADIVEPARRA